MAISILSTTTATLTNASFQVNIPATTAGSTIIVSIIGITAASGGNSVDNVQDQGDPGNTYSTALSDTRNDGGIRRFIQVYYRTNVQAGATYVLVVPQNGNGMTMHTVVYETSGVNILAPFEGSNTRNFNDSGTSSSGTALATVYTNALFIGVGVRTSAGVTSSGGGFSNTFPLNSGSTSGAHGNLIASTSATYVLNHPFQSVGNVIGIASFNPNANAFILDLDDSTSLSDSDENETAYDRTYPESISLADSFAFILGTLNYFKTLMDMLTLAESFTTVSTFIRSLSDTVTLIDSVEYVHNTQRTLADTLRVQDWVELQRNSDQWGS